MFKRLLYLGSVIAAVAIIALVYFTFEYGSKDALNSPGNTAGAPSPTAALTPASERTATYENREVGYSFEYPDESLAPGEERVQLPFFNSQQFNTAQVLKRDMGYEESLRCQYYQPCLPTIITNTKIGFTLVNLSLEQITQSKLSDVITDGTFGTMPVKVAPMGAEGEGIVYYFIPLNNKQTLMAYRYYLDEDIQARYLELPDFWSIQEQEQVFNKIAKSFKLLK